VIAGALDPLDHEAFQSLPGAIFTVLIAMEFKLVPGIACWLLRDQASQEPLKQLP
jgi:hypothetical protein